MKIIFNQGQFDKQAYMVGIKLLCDASRPCCDACKANSKITK